jgi:iron-sulfur cluster assembly accessory protein
MQLYLSPPQGEWITMSESLSETLIVHDDQQDESQQKNRTEAQRESQNPSGNHHPENGSSIITETDVLVDITEAAARKAAEALAGSSNQGIRIAVTGGGCAGLQYDLKPESGPTESDIVIDAFGVPFYLHPMVLPYIKGTRIDYVSSLMEGGFKFINPNAANTCGCGTSFGI